MSGEALCAYCLGAGVIPCSDCRLTVTYHIICPQHGIRNSLGERPCPRCAGTGAVTQAPRGRDGT